MNRNMNAADIVKMAEKGTEQLIAQVNHGKTLTREAYATAYMRTFPLFLDKFLNNIAAQHGAEKGAQVRETVVSYLEYTHAN